MAFLESRYYVTLLKRGLSPGESSKYRDIIQSSTGLDVTHFVDGFFDPFSDKWYLVAELSDGSFALFLEILKSYSGSEAFAPIYSGANIYHPCTKKAAERVLVAALNDFEENYAWDLENRFLADGNEAKAHEVRKRLSKSKRYLQERLNGVDEDSARTVVALVHLYD